MAQQSLSRKVAGDIQAAIMRNELASGEKLPSENELCETYGVSRSTVRAALKQLEAIGLVRSRQGAGTFVQERPDIQTGLQELDSITESIRRSGKVPGMEYSMVMRRPVVPAEAEYMNLSTGEQVLEIRRIISGDGVTLAYSYDLIPAAIIPEDFDPSVVGGSLFEQFRNDLGLFPHTSVAEVHAVSSRHVGWGKEASAHDLYVLLKQLHYDARGDLLLYSQTYFIEGRYTFTVHRSVSQ